MSQKEDSMSTGFFEGLKLAGLNVADWGIERTVPVARSDARFGQPEGDGAFIVEDDNGVSLVILELEASGPGNERNIVKWCAQYSANQALLIQLRNRGILTEYKRVDVVVCFGRELNKDGEDPWGSGAFLRAVAHAEYLAGILNDLPGNESLNFTVIGTPKLVDCFEDFGRDAAAQYSDQLGVRIGNDEKIGAA